MTGIMGCVFVVHQHLVVVGSCLLLYVDVAESLACDV